MIYTTLQRKLKIQQQEYSKKKKKQKNTDKDLHNTTEKTEDLATGIQQTK